MTTETPELALEELARRIDADGTASQIGSADEVREIATMIARRSAASAEPAVAVAWGYYDKLPGRAGETVLRCVTQKDRADDLRDSGIEVFSLYAAPPPSPVVSEAIRGLSIANLQRAHVERQEEWCPEQKPDLSFRGNEMAGEVGEACNVIKKLERERHGWRGSRATKEQLAEELADVVHTAVLCAITAGIDLDPAVAAKFNATSEKNGLSSSIAALSPAPAGEVGWRTMESAPKDGTHILVCHGPYSQHWTFKQEPPIVVHYWSNPGEEGFYPSWGIIEGSYNDNPVRFTHWMPLTSPTGGDK